MVVSTETFTENVQKLINKFESDRTHYLSKDYPEAQARIDFITPFFKAVEVEQDRIQTLSPKIKELYEDFGVLKGGKWTVPTNFNKLTPAWYLNCSKDNPNMARDEELEFYPLRDIEEGDELTVDYRTYSDYTKGCD